MQHSRSGTRLDEKRESQLGKDKCAIEVQARVLARVEIAPARALITPWFAHVLVILRYRICVCTGTGTGNPVIVPSGAL